MNKKVENKNIKQKIIYDDKEDLEIKRIAYLKNPFQKYMLGVSIILFCFMLTFSIIFISGYFQKKLDKPDINDAINTRNNILITNNGEIKLHINKESFVNKNDLKIEKINTIEYDNKDSKDDNSIKINIKYNILHNKFSRNSYSTTDSDVIVRFSYSYDEEEWTYINNVISINDSTIKPLMGNYYDVSGIEGNLNVSTNFEINASALEKVKMYWRSETVFKYNPDKIIDNNYEAYFKIEYKEDAK